MTAGGPKSVHKEESMAELSKAMHELADALRYAGFTVTEMFASFDRNGSNGISVSEFCSMLRLIIGNHINKRLLYRALVLVDSDGNKSISLDELLHFIYQVWRTQLDEIGSALQTMAITAANISENTVSNGKQIDTGVDRRLQDKLLKEREAIKNAIKRNFTREVRDQLEKTLIRDSSGHVQLNGPFANVLKRMGIGNNGSPVKPKSALVNNNTEGNVDNSPTAFNTSYNAGTTSRLLTANFSGTTKTKIDLAKSGSNELLRYRIKNASNTLPSRVGTKLRLPQVYDMNQSKFISAESTQSILRSIEQPIF